MNVPSRRMEPSFFANAPLCFSEKPRLSLIRFLSSLNLFIIAAIPERILFTTVFTAEIIFCTSFFTAFATFLTALIMAVSIVSMIPIIGIADCTASNPTAIDWNPAFAAMPPVSMAGRIDAIPLNIEEKVPSPHFCAASPMDLMDFATSSIFLGDCETVSLNCLNCSCACLRPFTASSY